MSKNGIRKITERAGRFQLLPVTPHNPCIAQCLLAIPFASLKAVQVRQVGKENGRDCRLPN